MFIQTKKGEKKITQAYLLQLLKEDPKGGEAKAVHGAIQTLYSEEFGLAFIYAALEGAKASLRKHKTKNIPQAVDYIVNQWGEPKEPGPERFYIGSREVGLSDYSVYTKGLYWLAGYEILNRN